MKVLITGAQGQVGQALLRAVPSQHVALAVSRAELDIAVDADVAALVARLKPDIIINAAAYTAVDRAESDVVLARDVNSRGVRNLAVAARAQAVRLVHISTDFVFDGTASAPYAVDAAANPLSVYGATKYQGELAVSEVLGGRGVVLRTAWVYAATGRNFMRTMLRLMAERPEVRVVADQLGTPTSAASIARALWQVVEKPDVTGIHHWTDFGVASWYDFAVAIAEEAADRGLIPKNRRVSPIATADYPTPARRPAYGVLDKAGTVAALDIEPRHWRQELRLVLDEVARG